MFLVVAEPRLLRCDRSVLRISQCERGGKGGGREVEQLARRSFLSLLGYPKVPFVSPTYGHIERTLESRRYLITTTHPPPSNDPNGWNLYRKVTVHS